MKPRALLAVFACAALAVGIWLLRARSRQSAAIPATAEEAVIVEPVSSGRHATTDADSQAWRDALAVAGARIGDLEHRLTDLERRMAELETRKRTQPKLLDIVDVPITPEPQTTTEKRGWGPEQAAGEPDTFQAADLMTAWAPRTQDGGPEWLHVTYDRAVAIAKVRVRETYNPGTIVRIAAIPEGGGGEITLWEGAEPRSVAPVEMEFTPAVTVTARSVKVYLDTSLVPGWNEIDAVELVGRDGSRQWAASANASSTYASGQGHRMELLNLSVTPRAAAGE